MPVSLSIFLLGFGPHPVSSGLTLDCIPGLFLVELGGLLYGVPGVDPRTASTLTSVLSLWPYACIY